MTNFAIKVDCRDEKKQKRFFPIGIEEHLVPMKTVVSEWWYQKNLYYRAAQGNLNCCSDTSAGFHYINAYEMIGLEYLTRKVFPFGMDNHQSETLPRKLSLNEIIQASDVDSPSGNYQRPEIIHNLEESEKY